MPKLVTLLLLTIAVCSLKAQTLTRDSVLGSWICRQVTSHELDPSIPNSPAMMDMAEKTFLNSTFTFDSQRFLFHTANKNAPMAMAEMMKAFNNQKWSLDKKENLIHIGDPRENIARFLVKRKGRLLFVIIDETPLLLMFEKI
ncbi:hypothetical protein [Chryseolinea lacunae]|uniref:Lipocalin-like domain-containing protein n=1 Tax=Chryseolinea lacunae TaxID=2801331 RepID=A0ABS1KPQ3_9BACT|nr:hypothetical protein [Chryseolinea lacunae]MBL0741449.1 hypothetical protein [Chryseolinea lacunae]